MKFLHCISIYWNGIAFLVKRDLDISVGLYIGVVLGLITSCWVWYPKTFGRIKPLKACSTSFLIEFFFEVCSRFTRWPLLVLESCWCLDWSRSKHQPHENINPPMFYRGGTPLWLKDLSWCLKYWNRGTFKKPKSLSLNKI
jgi:hypothetical protein